MLKRLFLSSILLLISAPIAIGQEAGLRPQTIDELKAKFQAQIAAVITAYRSGDTATSRRFLDQFRLPNSQDWFSQHFGAPQGANLAERYDRLYANFSEFFEHTVESVVAHSDADIVAFPDNGRGEAPSYVSLPGKRLSGMISVNHPNLLFAQLKITLDGRPSVSWSDTFTLDDGAFRFLGFGGWPFWVWEKGSEGSAPPAGVFGTPPVLVAATGTDTGGVAGTYFVIMWIDKNGDVTRVEPLRGDQRLRQAALAVARKWRFKPATLGGQPVESVANIGVNFVLRDSQSHSP
ncbi:MAG TPA: energy transducer TonB [Candidatus Acidoferrales bacterium]|nr:energy transducer TonB [Candidatus Acidoferrales bacterium]